MPSRTPAQKRAFSGQESGGAALSHGFSVGAILESLKSSGLRITQSRRVILDVLFASKRPMSLEEIWKEVQSQGITSDFATVFRTIAMLQARGIVHKVNLEKSCSYFELHDPSRHYDHLICTSCGQVVILEEPCPLADYEKELARRYGFRNLRHSLEFFGTCGNC